MSIACMGLRNTDVSGLQNGGMSDPMCIVHVRLNQGKWSEAGRTEVLLNTLDPVFEASVCVDYAFQVRSVMFWAKIFPQMHIHPFSYSRVY